MSTPITISSLVDGLITQHLTEERELQREAASLARAVRDISGKLASTLMGDAPERTLQRIAMDLSTLAILGTTAAKLQAQCELLARQAQLVDAFSTRRLAEATIPTARVAVEGEPGSAPTPIKLLCQMTKECQRDVTHIDNKGFLYCAEHGLQRSQGDRGRPCRELYPNEIAMLQAGKPIAWRASENKPAKPEPTPEQLQALLNFAQCHGRTWKAKLLALWANGRDDREPMGGVLRQIRNAFGPSWLETFKIPEARAAGVPPRSERGEVV
jgi:hypothetical protein